MYLLDLTLPTPAENVALDEALLDAAEAAGRPCEVLRLWEPSATMVVVGRSSRLAHEVHRDRCAELGVPVVRRPSGGAAVVAGPGCLMYALVLSREQRPRLRAIDEAHRFVLGRIADSLEAAGLAVYACGTSDLALEGRKFSGNSVRCKRTHLLYHGTLLYRFPLELIARLLPLPPRTPEYRSGRGHEAFVTNLPLSAEQLRAALATAWDARTPLADWPRELTGRLVAQRYANRGWTEQW